MNHVMRLEIRAEFRRLARYELGTDRTEAFEAARLAIYRRQEERRDPERRAANAAASNARQAAIVLAASRLTSAERRWATRWFGMDKPVSEIATRLGRTRSDVASWLAYTNESSALDSTLNRATSHAYSEQPVGDGLRCLEVDGIGEST